MLKHLRIGVFSSIPLEGLMFEIQGMTVDVFSLGIFIVSAGLTFLVTKAIWEIQNIKKDEEQALKLLRLRIGLEQKKNTLQRGKLKLLDTLQQSLFKRLFIITHRILLLQKWMVDEKGH